MKTRHILAALLAAVSLTSVSIAHPGHDGHDFTWTLTAGAVHPLTGLDHMMAMLAIGVWAVFLGGRLRWQVLSAFVASLLVGSLGGHLVTQAASLIEHSVIGTLFALGVLLTFALRPQAMLSVLLAAIFGVVHGCAHGVQMTSAGGYVGYTAGFVFTSILLLTAGLLLGLALNRHPKAARLAGVATASAGVIALT